MLASTMQFSNNTPTPHPPRHQHPKTTSRYDNSAGPPPKNQTPPTTGTKNNPAPNHDEACFLRTQQDVCNPTTTATTPFHTPTPTNRQPEVVLRTRNHNGQGSSQCLRQTSNPTTTLGWSRA